MAEGSVKRSFVHNYCFFVCSFSLCGGRMSQTPCFPPFHSWPDKSGTLLWSCRWRQRQVRSDTRPSLCPRPRRLSPACCSAAPGRTTSYTAPGTPTCEAKEKEEAAVNRMPRHQDSKDLSQPAKEAHTRHNVKQFQACVANFPVVGRQRLILSYHMCSTRLMAACAQQSLCFNMTAGQKLKTNWGKNIYSLVFELWSGSVYYAAWNVRQNQEQYGGQDGRRGAHRVVADVRRFLSQVLENLPVKIFLLQLSGRPPTGVQHPQSHLETLQSNRGIAWAANLFSSFYNSDKPGNWEWEWGDTLEVFHPVHSFCLSFTFYWFFIFVHNKQTVNMKTFRLGLSVD